MCACKCKKDMGRAFLIGNCVSYKSQFVAILAWVGHSYECIMGSEYWIYALNEK